MMFTKSAPVARSAFAQSMHPKFWGGSGSNSNGPGFFVSTPQFTRHQQSQLAPYAEDGRGAGNKGAYSESHGIDNPYLSLTAANAAAAAPALLREEDGNEEQPLYVLRRQPTADDWSRQTPQKSLLDSHLNSQLISEIPEELTTDVEATSDAASETASETAASETVSETASETASKPYYSGERYARLDSEMLGGVVDREDVLAGVLRKMRRLQRAGSHSAVLSTFSDLEDLIPSSSHQESQLPIEAYNIVLQSLAAAGDANVLLEGYERMLLRGLVPDASTFMVVLSALVGQAEQFEQCRLELSPILGASVASEAPLGSRRTESALEAVEETREGLPVEEHLMLALAIAEPMVRSLALSPELQTCVDTLVAQCLAHNIAVPSSIAQAVSATSHLTITMQSTLMDAVATFSELPDATQQSVVAQEALLNAYFRFDEPAGAIAFYSGCGATEDLAPALLVGLARTKLVAVARHWIDVLDPGVATLAAVLKAVAVTFQSDAASCRDLMPTSTAYFYKITTGGGGSNSNSSNSSGEDFDTNSFDKKSVAANEGRCAFLQLAVKAEDMDAVIMATKESFFSGAQWDSETISLVLRFLATSATPQPLLGADICAWQVEALQKNTDARGMRTNSAVEVVADFTRLLAAHNQLTLDAAFRLLPVALVCQLARRQLLELIAAAYRDRPDAIGALMSAQRLPPVATALAALYVSAPHRGTAEELELVAAVLPAFVRESLKAGAEFTAAEVADVREALLQSNNAELAVRWTQQAREAQVQALAQAQAQEGETAAAATPAAAVLHSAESEMSMNIVRYACTPNGIDYAMQIFRDQVDLGLPVSLHAVEALIAAALHENMAEVLAELHAALPPTAPLLNALADAAANCGDLALADRCHRELVEDLRAYPSAMTYVAMISAPKQPLDRAQALLAEAEATAELSVDAAVYNAMARKLAQHGQKDALKQLLARMQTLNFSLDAGSYSLIVTMLMKLGEGMEAFRLLKSLPETVKALLEVRVFNRLMHYFVEKSPNRKAALDVFWQLRETGTLATPYTYQMLIKAFLMREEGAQLSQQATNNIHINTINKNINNNALNKADAVLKLMRKDGTPITPSCFAELLRARGVIFKDFDGARNFYRGMVKHSRVLPDKSVFKALLESYRCNGRQAETGAVLEEMRRYRVKVDDELAALAAP